MATRKPINDAPPLPTRAQWQDWVAQQPTGYVPPNQLCIEDIADWEESARKLASAKATEAMLRERVFRGLFPLPEEGTNKVGLPDGRVVNATHKLNRKVEEPRLAWLRALTVGDMRERLDGMKIPHAHAPDAMLLADFLSMPIDKLVKWEPALATTQYRELTAEQRLIFDQVLEIKPSTPSIKIEHPKKDETP